MRDARERERERAERTICFFSYGQPIELWIHLVMDYTTPYTTFTMFLAGRRYGCSYSLCTINKYISLTTTIYVRPFVLFKFFIQIIK